MDFLKSALGNSDKSNLLSIVMSVIGEQSGGLSGLVSKFAANGVGDLIESWVGKGDNKSISPNQVIDILGADKISEIASKLGSDNDSVVSQLTEVLPQAIDKLTPEGKIPDGDILGKAGDLLGGLFK